MGYYNCSPPEPAFECKGCGNFFFELDDEGLCKECGQTCSDCGEVIGDAGETCPDCNEYFCKDHLDAKGRCEGCASAYCSACGDERNDCNKTGCRFEPSCVMDTSAYNAEIARLVFAEIKQDLENDFCSALDELDGFRDVLAGKVPQKLTLSYYRQEDLGAFSAWLGDSDMSVDELFKALAWDRKTVAELIDRAVFAVALTQIGETPGNLGGTPGPQMRGKITALVTKSA